MNFMRTYQLVFAFGLLAKIALGAEPHTNFPKALAEAKAHNKPVFIYVYDSI
jgi:hypothetical protein